MGDWLSCAVTHRPHVPVVAKRQPQNTTLGKIHYPFIFHVYSESVKGPTKNGARRRSDRRQFLCRRANILDGRQKGLGGEKKMTPKQNEQDCG